MLNLKNVIAYSNFRIVLLPKILSFYRIFNFSQTLIAGISYFLDDIKLSPVLELTPNSIAGKVLYLIQCNTPTQALQMN